MSASAESPPASGTERRVFRYSLLIRVPVFVASAFWAAMLVLLHLGGETRVQVYAGVVFFLVFFVVFHALYWRTVIVVGPEGLRYQGPLRRLTVPWSEVRVVRVYRGLFREYEVGTARGRFGFTGFLRGHRELLELIQQRARRRGLTGSHLER